LSLWLAARGSGGGDGGAGQSAAPPAPAPGFEAEQQAFQKLKVEADSAAALDAAGAKAKYGVKFSERLSYDPLTSQNMDKIRASALALSSADEALLAILGSLEYQALIPDLRSS
jgi:hypothetical protein